MRQTIKNIGILAHVDAGKTSLTEQLLYLTGAIPSLGRVDHGNTQTDTLALERERGITIKSMSTSYNYQGQKINIVDTPGHVDFVAEVERSLLLLDGAILVISAKESVQSHTKLLFNALKRMEIPTLIFVNKIDRMGVDLAKVITTIETQLSTHILLMQEVINQGNKQAQIQELTLQANDDLIELLSQVDETILLDYLEGKHISTEQLSDTLKLSVLKKSTYPILFGSALHGIGIQEILNAINELLPPFNVPDTDKPSGIVSSVTRMPEITVGRICVIKLTSGYIEHRGCIGEDKITHLLRWNHGEVEPVQTLHAGDIGIAVGLNHLNVGDTFGDVTRHNDYSLGKPMLKVKVLVEQPRRRKNLLDALTLIEENDPYLSYQLSEFSDQIYINLFGYVQMEIIQETLKRDFGVDIQMSDPMTIYMETPSTTAESVIAIHEDGLPFDAGIGFRIEPLPRGSGIQYVSELKIGGLTRRFLNGIEDGIFSHLDQGLHGWELTDMKIVLIDYQLIPDSTPAEYRNLCPLVIFDALKKAGTELLWPISEYQLFVPTTEMGKAMSDLRKMKASIATPAIKGNNCIITGVVPIALSQNYEVAVHQYTSGMGYFESKFCGYENAPRDMYRERPRFKVDPANRGEYLRGIIRT